MVKSMQRCSNGHVVRALTVAGSDSGGGAGVQADVKTMHQFGVYGLAVITAVTAQNTLGVQGIHELPADFVGLQLRSVLADIGADAVKTGMLASAAIIETVADVLDEGYCQPLVVDPVMVAKGGAPLLADSAVRALTARLIPRAAVLTPNIPEAGALCGFALDTWASVLRAAQALAAAGASTVVIKGGHMEQGLSDLPRWRSGTSQSLAVDTVLLGGQFTYFLTQRVASNKTHGTGCTFSAAITAMLAAGIPVLDAIAGAKAYIYQAIASAVDWDVGNGHGPTDHSVRVPCVVPIEAGGVYLWQADGWQQLDG